MAKITREPMKIFGSSAGTNQIAQFGSLFAGTPTFSTDPSTIQALTNYLTGWFGAAIGGNSPAIEDMNAICYLFAYQLAYLMQTGTPEWDNTTTYYIGSIVQDGLGNEFVSIADNNLNNATSDATKWKGRAGILPLGSVIASFPNLTGAYVCSATTAADAQGYVKCNGQTIADATSPMNGQVVPNINNSVFLMGSTTAGTAGGSNNTTLTSTQLPAHTHAFTSSNLMANSTHTHGFAHAHQWGAWDNGPGIWMPTSVNGTMINQGRFNVTDANTNARFQSVTATSGPLTVLQGVNTSLNAKMFTMGPLNSSGNVITETGTPSATTAAAGTTNSTGSGTAYDSRPSFISAVYLMRIK